LEFGPKPLAAGLAPLEGSQYSHNFGFKCRMNVLSRQEPDLAMRAPRNLHGPAALTPRAVHHRTCDWEILAMSGTTDKIKGKANEIAGSVKKSVGKTVGNDRMTIEGAGQEIKGDVQQSVGKAKDAFKKAKDRD
jgi:uncharacterized protein YjbJ (UPF0337 family)